MTRGLPKYPFPVIRHPSLTFRHGPKTDDLLAKTKLEFRGDFFEGKKRTSEGKRLVFQEEFLFLTVGQELLRWGKSRGI